MSKMEQDKPKQFTEVEERLIDAISNFLLWYTTEEDRGIVEYYIVEDDTVDYNEWFKLKED